jgi:hypothetical protein
MSAVWSEANVGFWRNPDANLQARLAQSGGSYVPQRAFDMQDVFHLVREFFRVKGFEADQGFLFRSLDIFPSPSDVDDTDLRIEGAGAGGHLETIGAGAKVDIGHENREAVWLGLDEALERFLARMSREDFDSVVAKRPLRRRR